MFHFVRSTAAKGLNAARIATYHKHHRQQANIRLAAIEATQGKTDPAQIRFAQDYAADVLGSKIYAPWLVAYTAFTGTFKEGWIPDNYFGRVVTPRLNGAHGQLPSHKSTSHQYFGSDAFPNIGSWVNGLFYSATGEIVAEADFCRLLFEDTDRIIFKLDASAQGLDVHVIDQADFDINWIKAAGNGVFQRYVEQHEVLSTFSPSAAAPLRLTTVIDDHGNCTLRASYLKLGRLGEKSTLSTSQIRIIIDLETGQFSDLGHYTNWTSLSQHPDTGIAFAGHAVPHFAD